MVWYGIGDVDECSKKKKKQSTSKKENNDEKALTLASINTNEISKHVERRRIVKYDCCVCVCVSKIREKERKKDVKSVDTLHAFIFELVNFDAISHSQYSINDLKKDN